MRPTRVLLLASSLVALALPLRAEIFTVKLSNGTAFETRYKPKQAAWDPSVLVVIDETGLEIALPKSLVASVDAQSETKGFGKVINTTTLDLGFAPNDLTAEQQAASQAQQQMGGLQQFFNKSFDQKQFVDPSDAGGGVPVFGATGGYGGYTPVPQVAPMPAPAPAPSTPSGSAPAASSPPPSSSSAQH